MINTITYTLTTGSLENNFEFYDQHVLGKLSSIKGSFMISILEVIFAIGVNDDDFKIRDKEGDISLKCNDNLQIKRTYYRDDSYEWDLNTCDLAHEFISETQVDRSLILDDYIHNITEGYLSYFDKYESIADKSTYTTNLLVKMQESFDDFLSNPSYVVINILIKHQTDDSNSNSKHTYFV